MLFDDFLADYYCLVTVCDLCGIQQVLLESKETREQLARQLMGHLETKESRVCQCLVALHDKHL